jgi:hypothetical protein
MQFIGDDPMGADEILGLDEILGDDLFGADLMGLDTFAGDEMGAANRRQLAHRRPAMNRAQQIAMARAAGGAAVGKRSGQGAYEQVLPFPATTVLSLASTDIELRPQRLFRVERLTVGSSIARYFVITNISVGQDPQFVATGQVPAEVFSEVGVGVRLKGATANLGNTVVVSVTNIDTTAASQVFRAAIIGTCVY